MTSGRNKISPNQTIHTGVFDDEYQEQMYSMTVKSNKLASAKKKLPFNVDNISKHSLKAKLTQLDTIRSPKSTKFEAFESKSEFSAKLDA